MRCMAVLEKSSSHKIIPKLNCTHKTIDFKGFMKKDGNTKQLTVLVDIDELKEFQSACRTQDMNSSQVLRAFIRDYIKKYGKQESKK